MQRSTVLPEMGFSTAIGTSSPVNLYPIATQTRPAEPSRHSLPEEGFLAGLYPPPPVAKARPVLPVPATTADVSVAKTLAPATLPVTGRQTDLGEASEIKRLKAAIDALERRLIAREDVIATMTRENKKHEATLAEKDVYIEQLRRDSREHATELKAEQTRSVESQSHIAELVQNSVRIQEALVIAQSQLQDAKHVISIYEDRITRLEYDAAASNTLVTADFSLGTYPCIASIDSLEGLSMPYDILPGRGIETVEDYGVEESKGAEVYDDNVSSEAEFDDRSGSEVDVGDRIESLDGDAESTSDAAESVDDAAITSENDGNEVDAAIDVPVLSSNTSHATASTTRRVLIKKGGFEGVTGAKADAAAKTELGGPESTGDPNITFIARVKAMSTRDIARLTVPELTALLEGLGKRYCKPKAAAVALLISTAKDL